VIGTVLASFVLAGVFGSLACTFLGDIWGRRWTIFAATATETVGVILMGSSFQFAQFIVARIILGLGTGQYAPRVLKISFILILYIRRHYINDKRLASRAV
jgi:MFS family permease